VQLSQLSLLYALWVKKDVLHTDFSYVDYKKCGPGSVVGIAIGYGMDGWGDWIPVGARFSAPVQTSPRDLPASCTMGTGSFPGGGKEQPGHDADPSPPSGAMVMKE